MKLATYTLTAVMVVGVVSAVAQARRTLPRLKVSDNKRFLVQEDGKPFFYLGDTAWELFHRLTREEAATYLKLRAEQKFTVIQAVALAEFDGLTEPNAYGSLPLTDLDPARPAVTAGADPKNRKQYDYWDHVEYIVDEANRQGLYIGLLPSCGSGRRASSGFWAATAPPTRPLRYGVPWRAGLRSESTARKTTRAW
jgi:hypothetical protein